MTLGLVRALLTVGAVLARLTAAPWWRLCSRGDMMVAAIFVRSMSTTLVALCVLAACDDPHARVRCVSDDCQWTSDVWARLASLTLTQEPPRDRSNRFDGDADAIALGQRFFFGTQFTLGATGVDPLKRPAPSRQPMSCAACHDLARAGVDTASSPGHVSVGAGQTDVNALAVVNAAYLPVMFWNGRADSLWALNAIVGESATTMNGHRLMTAQVLATTFGGEIERLAGTELPDDWRQRIGAVAAPVPSPQARYQSLSPEDQRLVTDVYVIWAKVIAAYEAKLVSRRAPFDRWVADGPESDELTAAAQRGARLFAGKAGCVDCHDGPLFSDGDFHVIGVPQLGAGVPTLADCPAGSPTCDCVAGKNCLPWGAHLGLERLRASAWLRTGPFSDDPQDRSREAYVQRASTPELRGAWRTPSLRNVALTAPYMHDGVYRTLDEVIWHYDTGGASVSAAVGTRAASIKPLGLTARERADLVEFLQSLTGEPLPAELTAGPPEGAL